MYAAAQEEAHAASKSTGIYLCDMPTGLGDNEIYGLMSQWGRISSFERINQGSDEALLVEYDNWEAARDARRQLNYSSVRGKTVRCLLRENVKTIRQSMLTGHRFVVDNCDLTLESTGLFDACCLFGHVLDCKVEKKEDGSCGIGFVHYATTEEAAKASSTLDNMQLGEKTVTVRPFEWEDTQKFAGCHYSTHINRELSASANAFTMPQA
mmetsp:Transcript_83131/g.130765  ORF Transcript_83131/g.130765 Transcript_83131/m.130765 type:complete len:210 (-) Transcript_83131:14-643(-)